MSIQSLAGSVKNGMKDANANYGMGYLDSLSNQYIVKPVHAQGIYGFVFDYEGSTRIALESDITEHYTEDNNNISDHIALKPIKLTLHGFVAELMLKKPAGVLGALAAISSRLGTVPAYLGNQTPGFVQKLQNAATAATNAANAIDTAVTRAENVVGMLSGAEPGPTKQQRAYEQLAALWKSKQICTVETPHKYFSSMAIQSVMFEQDEDTKYITDIVVTLKEIRFATIETTAFNNKRYAGRYTAQAMPGTDGGKTAGPYRMTSLIKEGYNNRHNLSAIFHPGINP